MEPEYLSKEELQLVLRAQGTDYADTDTVPILRRLFRNAPQDLEAAAAYLQKLELSSEIDRLTTLDSQNRGKLYSGMMDCFVKIWRTEGFRGFYKGIGANYMRLGPHTILLLVCWDQLKLFEEYIRSS